MSELDPQKIQQPTGGEPGVVRAADVGVTDTPWGTLQWMVSGTGGTSENMTLGRVTFKPGQANPPHHHSNCEEVLFVVSGQVEHTLPGGGTTVLNPGDCIVLGKGVKHHARNVGAADAIVIVAFNTANRKTVSE